MTSCTCCWLPKWKGSNSPPMRFMPLPTCYLAGIDTVASMLSLTMLQFARQPQQYAGFHGNPESIAESIDELLRLNAFIVSIEFASVILNSTVFTSARGTTLLFPVPSHPGTRQHFLPRTGLILAAAAVNSTSTTLLVRELTSALDCTLRNSRCGLCWRSSVGGSAGCHSAPAKI